MPTETKPKETARRTSSRKPGHTVGIEFDHLAIRGARLAQDGSGGAAVDMLSDVTGNFSEDRDLIEGLMLIKDQLKMGPRDTLATCLAGKQVSASQVTFRRLPAEEMEQALRIEMRKSIPFEIAGSTLDYQVLSGDSPQAETAQVLVAVAASGLLSRQLKVLEKAGLTPHFVDVLPVAVGNALWSWTGAPKGDYPYVAVHIGPQISTIVIDGARSPFFNRYIYFAAEDFVGREPTPDIEKRVASLAEEVARSLAFYEKNSFATGFQEVTLLGEYLETPALADRIRRQTGLSVRKMDLPRKLGLSHDRPAGRFDLAVSMAIRAGEE